MTQIMNATDAMEETQNSILEANIIIKRNLANFPFAMFLRFERIWGFFYLHSSHQ